jgi:hypothetical protein
MDNFKEKKNSIEILFSITNLGGNDFSYSNT